ncbi:hypothetical protein [Streptomyces heilongjiangensis]|uniref:Uncharacterized protein n=1 Tax=Streptomyces heilongjiangensis TaxID=945052 RepID=A0ABW1B2U3_9ACTN|nr:hypothetical protein [Streptomyces heilongjiangensis]MDC2950051.1 hypothetical protein [Streptomyces heilongjiangensis]
MKENRRLRRMVVGNSTWHWTVRRRSHRTHGHCLLKLTLYPEGPRRRLVLVFAPAENRVVSSCYFAAGDLVRLPDRTGLNLYEPATVRRLLDAASPALDRSPSAHTVELDGWPYFDTITAPPPADPTTGDLTTGDPTVTA